MQLQPTHQQASKLKTFNHWTNASPRPIPLQTSAAHAHSLSGDLSCALVLSAPFILHSRSTWERLEITETGNYVRAFSISHPLERKWRLRLAAMCGLTAISCSIIYIITEFVFCMQPHTRHPWLSELLACVWENSFSRSIKCLLHVWLRHRARQTKAKLSIKDSTYVLVLEEAQHFQLSEDALRGDERLEHIGQLLQRHSTTVARICHGPARRQKQNQKLV